ncbi:MAG: hypothetical protein E5X67_04605 [Mesorhizobium sp.]|uniref:hypothetical protein n=1 Tax=Mesorhizobium sp. TaxID=1871066 RepID=UPI001214FEC6|nr:hypothetical protein [Mesorhizobium sp.]TIP30052.1 MAG: hypothetical protein E5X67_04605 [Mesorhizobium sp.]
MPWHPPKNAAAQNGACIRNGARYASAMTGYATMTASRERGTIYVGVTMISARNGVVTFSSGS